LWINSSIFTTDAENFLIFLSVSLWNYIIIDNAFINITLKVGKKIYWGLFSLVFTLFGYYYLIPTNGVLGLCVALIIGRVVFIFLLNTIVNEEYGIVTNKKFYSLIHPISFVFFSTFLYLNVEFFDVNSFKLNVKIILFIFFFALTLFTYLFLLKTKAQRSQIVVYLKKSLNKTNQDK